MEDIYKILSDALAAEQAAAVSGRGAPGKAGPAGAATLLNKYPIALDPAAFANPLSTSNPGGSLISLWRFRQLTDPLPQPGDTYAPSGASLEMNYSQIVKGALSVEDGSFASLLIAQAGKSLATQTFANMDGNPGEWRPVFAVPDNWFDLKPSETKTLKIQMPGPGADGKGLAGAMGLRLARREGSSFTELPLDMGSRINSIDVDYQVVAFSRPWFNPMLLQSSGWYLKGQKAGFCSSGDSSWNGVLAAVPSSMIIGTKVSIDAEWSGRDQGILDAGGSSGGQVSLGPLPVSSTGGDSRIYVIGWGISLMPFSPQVGG